MNSIRVSAILGLVAASLTFGSSATLALPTLPAERGPSLASEATFSLFKKDKDAKKKHHKHKEAKEKKVHKKVAKKHHLKHHAKKASKVVVKKDDSKKP